MIYYALQLGFAYVPLFLVAILIAIIMHECAHGLMAKWNGDLTAQYSGRITLNPVKHFDAIGFLMLLFAGFGFAKPVPVNPNNFKKRRRGIFLVSIAGIATNLILALFSALFYVIIERFAGTDPHPVAVIFQIFFNVLVMININLAIFNLLPLFPLDGHRLLESVTKPLNKVTKFLRDFGMIILLILLGIDFIFGRLASINSIFDYFSPLGVLMRYAGGGLRESFLNFWRLIFGVSRNWLI